MMRQSRKLGLIANLILCFVLQTLGADKYTDENRPYEFGFKIDGQQHRHESKDENGIIMGEFGFVTADDVYHVTVYATDKEGRFKILSMKNIHLKSTPDSGFGTTTSARQGHALALPPAPASVQVSATPKQSGVSTQPRLGPFTPQAGPISQGTFGQQPRQPFKPLSIELPGKSCSSCSLPTTTTRAPPPAYNQVTANNNYNSPNQIVAPGLTPQNQGVFLSSPGQQNNAQGRPISSSYSPGDQQHVPQRELVAPNGAQSFAPQLGQAVQNYPGSPSHTQRPGVSTRPNNVQSGSSGLTYNARGSQQNYPSSQQNIPQVFVAPNGAQFSASKPSQIPQTYPRSPNYSQGPSNNALGGPSGSTYSPQGDQQNYPSSQQNAPQGGFVAPVGVQTFTLQPGLTPQNYPGSPNYSQEPSVFNTPNNYAQPGAEQQAGLLPINPREQNGLFGGNSYTGAGPSVSASTVPDTSNFGQNYPQLSLPNKAQFPGKSSYPQGGAGERTPKQYSGPRQQFISNLGPQSSQGPSTALGATRGSPKPMLVTAQMQIVDKNTDIYALGPNEQKGLPPGLSHSDMTQLLYTFNYTVGFHGHFEEGYANGVKQGYYFVTGRNGVRTRIDYVADDTGFHPKVSQEVLDLLSEDVPKPETEKDEKYGLKGYEFKWLYYPVETK